MWDDVVCNDVVWDSVGVTCRVVVLVGLVRLASVCSAVTLFVSFLGENYVCYLFVWVSI